MPEKIRLLVVDDHPMVRQGLVALLRTVHDMQVVAEASDGQEAVEEYNRNQPDVTLMDLRLQKVGGVEAIQLIRAGSPLARIIVLTTFDGDEDIYRAMKAGAKGYLLKGMSVEELIDAIRAVHHGKSRVPAEIAEKLAERLGGPQLTNRELGVLQLIVHGRSNKEIGSDLAISEATVKSHINSLLAKLGVTDRTQAATAAIQRGIVHLD
ncbi:MAG: response regulator transcription factor [Acidobacteriota bacterium]|nr:response regulator transcription factor [Acidobacteriota bacterium]